MKLDTQTPARSRVERFKAVIRARDHNPFVEVPGRVTRALGRYAHAGRITVMGTLNRVPIRATLMPVTGRHRLYVNGGMRAATGVDVGDTVIFELRGTRPGAIAPPKDVTDALRRVPGAASRFGAISSSHRRELLRYIDDARTPEARRRRIDRSIDHLLGRRGSAGRRTSRTLAERPLWTCPRCGHQFVNRNQFHACQRHDLWEPFRGKPAHIRSLFDRFRAIVDSCGPVTLVPYAKRIGFMVRVRFAGATPHARWLDVGFWLPRRLSDPRIQRVETILANCHLHTVRITRPGQLDARLAGWLREAYRVGGQEHLRGARE
jgi:hypothetical protein